MPLPSDRHHPAGTDSMAMMRYDAARRSVLVAYLLWFFLGYFGVHRFYLGRVWSGLAMLALFGLSSALTVLLVGYAGLLLIGVWWVVDLLLIPGMTAGYNRRVIAGIGR